MEYSKTIFRALLIKAIFAAIVCLPLVSNNSHALGLSTFLIYMDFNKRTNNFLTFNKDQYTQHCTLFLRHYRTELGGKKTLIDEDTVPENSASSWLRFSPKRFSLKPGKTQNVKFRMRRKANTSPNEYISYLAVDCEFDIDEITANSNRAVTLTPRLRHNVPIIVRTGKLDAAIRFDDIQLKKDSLSVLVHRSGDRSTHGKLQLIDKRNDKILGTQSPLSIYTEMQFKEVDLATSGVDRQYLLLRFTEDPKTGGTIVVEQTIQ